MAEGRLIGPADQTSASYLALQPFGQVPALELGDDRNADADDDGPALEVALDIVRATLAELAFPFTAALVGVAGG